MAAIPFAGLDHVVLRTQNVDLLLDFYCGKLGCVLEREVEGFNLYQLRAGQCLIDLLEVSEPIEENSHYDHFCLQVIDLDETELLERLDEMGVPHGPAERRYGATGFGMSVYTTDPDGRTVELKLVGSGPE